MDAVCRRVRALLVDRVRRRSVRRISYQRSPATPGVASTAWLVTSDSYVPKFRYASRKVGRCRYERMSRNCAGFVMPGCGRQSRLVGAHGKIESNAATGSCGSRSERRGGRRASTAPRAPRCSARRTSRRTRAVVLRSDDRGRRVGRIGRRLPSMSGGSRPSPISSSGTPSAYLEEELDGAGVRLAVHHLVLLERVDADAVPVDRARSRAWS